MIKKAYLSFRDYTLGKDFEKKEDLFEIVKTKLVFNLIMIFTVVCLLSFLKIFYFSVWSLLGVRVLALSLVVLSYLALKKYKHYHIPINIWTFSFALLGLLGFLLKGGQLTYANLGFVFLNITIVFLMLNKYLKIIYFIYYFLFISYSLAVHFKMIDHFDAGFGFIGNPNTYTDSLSFSLFPFFLVIYVLYGFVTYEFRVKSGLKEQINFIVGQENKINSANASMTKSIELASQIQKAFLPNLSKFSHIIQDYFVFLKPQNNLSGDFYWSIEEGDNLYLGLIDSNENNITGAIVSSIYFDVLDTAVKHKKLSSTNDIICFLNQQIKSKADLKHLKDGIQISVLRIDVSNKKLYYSSEKNSMYFAQNRKKVIDEYRAESIQKEGSHLKYREVSVDYDSGDQVYLTSDGFAGQFKGFDNDRFKESVLKAYLATIKNESFSVQEKLLSNKLSVWNDGGLQSDDVCMIGIRF